MESLKIVALCVVAAVLYGIAHDQVTARVCIEYFTIGHPPVFGTNSPTLLAIGWGVIATWWVGVLLGVPLAVAARYGRRPRRRVGTLVRPVAKLLACIGVLAVVSGAAGWFVASRGWVVLLGRFASDVPVERHARFIADLWAHSASYLGGFVGGVVLSIQVWRTRRRVAEGFRLVRGVHVEDLSRIREGYSVRVSEEGHSVFTVNVSAERLRAVFERLTSLVVDPGFLVLEVGTNETVERSLRVSSDDPLHNDVFYLDGMTHRELLELMDRGGELLIHDGGIQFGYGSGSGKDEVFVRAYKILSVFADDPDKYHRALSELCIERVAKLRTVWDNFTPDSPGSRRVLDDGRRSIWDLIEELKGAGLYLAERRES